MYHPSRGGVRGGKDQFSWDDVKVDKHRENYMGHSIKAPVGRWQKGKDLHWYSRDKKGNGSNTDALKDEIKRIKEEEEQAMREALGLAPKRLSKSQGSRLDKHEFSELMKRGSTAEDLGAGHADAAWVQGLGFAKAPRPWEDPSTLPSTGQVMIKPEHAKEAEPEPSVRQPEPENTEIVEKNRKRKYKEKQSDENRREKRDRHDKRHPRDSGHRRHNRDKENRRYDVD